MRTCLLLLAFLSFTARAQETTDVNLTDLIRESQQWVRKDGKMSLAWWIPNEYWRIALAGNKDVPADAAYQLEQAFKDYILICAADLTISSIGTMDYASEQQLRLGISITDANGNKYFPLSDSEINSHALQVAEAIKPMFAQLLGEMGKGMKFFFFDTRSGKQNQIKATEPGLLKVTHSNQEFTWTLPLSTLVPLKICPIDNAKMKGTWVYCPYHGQKLEIESKKD